MQEVQTQEAIQPVVITVTPQFQAAMPEEPKVSTQVAEISQLAVVPEKRDKLICKDLLVGDTRLQAEAEAAEILPELLENTQVLANLGNTAIEAVNSLNERMLRDRPPVNIPELQEAMKQLNRRMRGMGRKYDPNDPKVLKKYEDVKGGILTKLGWAKTFFEEFMDDIRSLQQQLDRIEEQLQNKQFTLLKNVAYYDEFYRLNEAEIGNLIYEIAVMEFLKDMVGEKAKSIVIGDSAMGDRGEEDRAELLELVNHLENRIIAFKGRLWVAWAMAPQIRTMRAISLGLSARIDNTIDVIIPTMINTIVIWLTMSEAEQANAFNSAVEATFNEVMTLFANATKATVPLLADALATPSFDPRTIQAWTDSLSAQADGIVKAIETGQQKRRELEQAIINGKVVINEATNKVNTALLNQVIDGAVKEIPVVARSVPAQTGTNT